MGASSTFIESYSHANEQAHEEVIHAVFDLGGWTIGMEVQAEVAAHGRLRK
jgi:hypothetical protein